MAKRPPIWEGALFLGSAVGFVEVPWLSLWESCRRRQLRGSSLLTLSVLAALGHLSQRERQGCNVKLRRGIRLSSVFT